MCQKTPSFAGGRRLLRNLSSPIVRRRRRGASDLLQPGQRVVHAEVLVVARDELDEPTRQLLEDGEVADDVEEALRRAHAADDRLDRDAAFLALGVDLLPFEEVLPGRGDGADLRLGTVREDDEPVRDEDVRDRVAVVGEVVVVGVLEVAVRRLQLDEDERDAVDEAEEVGPALVQVALDPELRDEEEVVVGRVLPVDDGEPLGLPAAVRLANGDRDAVAEQLMHLPVRPRVVESAPVFGDLGDRLVDRVGGASGLSRSSAARSRWIRKTSLRVSRPSVPSAPSVSWYALMWSQPSSPNSSMAASRRRVLGVGTRGDAHAAPPRSAISRSSTLILHQRRDVVRGHGTRQISRPPEGICCLRRGQAETWTFPADEVRWRTAIGGRRKRCSPFARGVRFRSCCPVGVCGFPSSLKAESE